MMTFYFKNTDTSEKFDKEFSTNVEKDDFLSQNPHIAQLIKPISAVSPYSVGRRTTDNSFRTVMKHINQTTHGANVNSGNLSEI